MKLQIDGVGEAFATTKVTKINAASKKFKLSLDSEAVGHLGAADGDTLAIRTGQVDGKACLVVTKAKITA